MKSKIHADFYAIINKINDSFVKYPRQQEHIVFTVFSIIMFHL